jgi:hypothetical protein
MTTAVGGKTQKAWGLAETTYNTPVAISATDAFDYDELSIQPTETYNRRNAHTGDLSLKEEIQEKRAGTWSATTYVAPNAVGVAPDIGFLLAHAFGEEAIVASTSVTYNLKSTTPSGLQISRYATDRLFEQFNGGWIETFEAEYVGGEEGKFTFSGGLADYSFLYQGATVSGAVLAAETTIPLAAGGALLVGKNVSVKFATEDNGGAGYTVTAVDTTADTITISPGLAGPLAGSEALLPNVPAHTVSGAALGSIACGLTLGGTTVNPIRHKLTFETGIIPLDKEASSATSTGLLRDAPAGGRVVTGELGYYYSLATAPYIGGAHSGQLLSIASRIGADVAGSRATINHPSARIEIASSDSLEDGQAREDTQTYIARQSAAADDELTLVFD